MTHQPKPKTIPAAPTQPLTSGSEPSHFESLYPADSRFEEVERIISFIKNGSSCQLVGLPGTGKSNLLGLLTYNRNVRLAHLGENQKWFHFVYMDFSEVKKRDFADVLKFMIISLSYSLQERGLSSEYKRVHGILLEVKNFQDELITFQALKSIIDYLAIEKELTIVFLFDRFDQYVLNLREEFFSNLKILRNRAKYRFSCVFALNRELSNLIEPAVFAEFYEFLAGNVVFLKLRDEPGLSFRLAYLEKATEKKADQKLRGEILKQTAGHGKLTRLSYEAILSETSKISDLVKLLLSKKTIQGALFEIWNFLTPEERQDIKRGDKDEFLEKTGLVVNGKIIIPLFDSYLTTFTLSEVEGQKLTFDIERNEILKGEENLTEKLSPSEFRLLKFLLTNQGRVCEKDEIIQVVWKDTKTYEGVTDQALDQIIYRLRKKIEEDPNNPKLIQTIKGRGYKSP